MRTSVLCPYSYMRRDPNQRWEENLVFEVGIGTLRGDLEEVSGVLPVAHGAFLGTAAARPGRCVILGRRPMPSAR